MPEEISLNRVIKSSPSLLFALNGLRICLLLFSIFASKSKKRELVRPKMDIGDLDKALSKILGFEH